jgi:hypothetical protein
MGMDRMFTARIPPRIYSVGKRSIEIKMPLMAKKTEMSSSSLWIATVVLLALTAWMFFKR